MRVYVDTSVIGGCLEDEFKEWSLRLMDEFREGRKRMVVSALTTEELEQAPDEVQAVLTNFPVENVEIFDLTPQALALAEAYVREGAVGAGCAADAQHIAAATVARVDVLVSWNFKHIVNLRRIQLYNAVNLKQGYALIDIRTPREVLDEKSF
ncbi:MAG: PIN domain protein [Kiritimatiellaeota bacterium]|nr:PIN domain protein [Kiritimatiellota bacterium]